MTLGEKIRKRRRELNFTLATLAEKAGISVGFLSDLENNIEQKKEETSSWTEIKKKWQEK